MCEVIVADVYTIIERDRDLRAPRSRLLPSLSMAIADEIIQPHFSGCARGQKESAFMELVDADTKSKVVYPVLL